MLRTLLAALACFPLLACGPVGWKVLERNDGRALRAVHVSSREYAALAGDQGQVYELNDVTLSDTSTDAAMPLRVPDYFGVVHAGELTVAGDRGLVLSRHEAGWFREDSRSSDRLLAMTRVTPTVIYAAGEGGRVVSKRAGEPRWQGVDVNAPGGAKITGIWGIAEDAVVLSTDRGTIIEQVRGQWVTERVLSASSSTALPLFAVWSSTRGADLIAVGLGGSIFRRAAGADGWSLESSPVREDLYGLWGSAPDRIFAVGSNGTILKYDGSSWAGVPSGTGADLFAIHGSSDGTRAVAVGARGALVILDEDL